MKSLVLWKFNRIARPNRPFRSGSPAPHTVARILRRGASRDDYQNVLSLVWRKKGLKSANKRHERGRSRHQGLLCSFNLKPFVVELVKAEGIGKVKASE